MASSTAMKVNGKQFQGEYQRINTKDLEMHPIAQRDFMKYHGDALANKWDWDLYDPVSVSYRDGKYWIIDGDHRVYAIKKNAGGHDVTILCRVFVGMTERDEAEYFLRTGEVKKALATSDKFAVRYKMGDADVVGMVKGAEEAGWTVPFKKGQKVGAIISLSTLMSLYLAVPYETYVRILKTQFYAWGNEKMGADGRLLKGMWAFYKSYDGEFDENYLREALIKVKPELIIRDAQAYRTSLANKANDYGAIFKPAYCAPYARAILGYYNKGRRSKKLPDKF